MKKIFVIAAVLSVFISCGSSGPLKKETGDIPLKTPEKQEKITVAKDVEAVKQDIKKVSEETVVKKSKKTEVKNDKAVMNKNAETAEIKDCDNGKKPVKTSKKFLSAAKAKKYYPAHVGDTLYFQGYWKNDEKKELQKVRAVIKAMEKKDGIEYYYYESPRIGIRYLIRKKENGVFMRVIKYPFPLFGFLIEVNIKPEMCVMKFPVKVGEKWTEKCRAETRLFGFWDAGRDIQSDFEVMGIEKVQSAIGEIEAVHIKVLVDDGSGNAPTTEEYWYGKGIGYSRADTSSHYVQIVGYSVFDEKTGKTVENLPPDGAENYD